MMNHDQEIQRTARFIAAGACLSDTSPFVSDTTGGDPQVQDFDATGSLQYVYLVRPVEKEAPQCNPIARALEQIQQTFGLTQEQLAGACGVTRAVIGRWKSGSATPRDTNQRRLFQLREAAIDWQKEGYPAPDRALQMPLVQGKALIDLLQAERLNTDAILFAGSRLKLMALEESSEVIPNPFE